MKDSVERIRNAGNSELLVRLAKKGGIVSPLLDDAERRRREMEEWKRAMEERVNSEIEAWKREEEEKKRKEEEAKREKELTVTLGKEQWNDE